MLCTTMSSNERGKGVRTQRGIPIILDMENRGTQRGKACWYNK